VLAATALGKVAPAAPRRLGLSLGHAGWLVSAITAVAALLGTPAGLWVRRRGGRRALLAGLLVLAVAGAAGAAAPGLGWMLAARVVEGAGFLLVVVAAPSLMAQMAGRSDQPAVLALWGTAIAVGLAASALAGGVLAPLGWRLWLAAPGILAVPVAAAVAHWVPPDTPIRLAGPHDRAAGGSRLRLADLRVPALLASGFCAVVLIASALLGVLPTFLVEERAGGNTAAGTATAVVALSSVLGTLAAGWLLGRGVGRRAVMAAGLVMPLASWPMVRPGGSFGASVLAAALLLAANGAMVAGVFAAVPRVAAAPDHLAVVNGLIAQLGSAGTLLGPPLFALAVGAAGWQGVSPLVAVFTGCALVALLLAEQRADAR
jgi:MFS family permease